MLNVSRKANIMIENEIENRSIFKKSIGKIRLFNF